MSGRKLVLIVGVAAFVTAGCGGEESSSEPEAGTAQPGSDLAADAGSTEVEGPEPRLVVADADSGRVDVIDLGTEQALESFDVGNPSRLVTVNERYVVAVDSTDGHVHFLEPGSWSIDHGDHSHSYAKSPSEIGSLDGEKPAHVIVGDRKVAVFFDGTGTADVVDFDALSDGDSTVATTLEVGEPHHGIVVPMSDHYVVSTGGTEDELPSALELLDESGRSVRTLDGTCPEMHGEVVLSNYFLVACEDGVLKVEGTDFTTTKLPYPNPENRAWSFDGSGPLVSAATADGVLVLDSRSGEWVHATTADEAVASGISGDGKTVFSVQQDGTFRTFDAVTGAELSSTPLMQGPVEAAEIQVAGNRVYVFDPGANSVSEIDYRDSGRAARTFELDFSPASIGVVGA